jgi:uncharacterized protein YjbI with pentapeptide repeats
LLKFIFFYKKYRKGIDKYKRGCYLCHIKSHTKKNQTMTVQELLAAYATGERDFSGANLIGANLIGANLSEANFSEANFSGAYLIGANLSGADLSGANLSGANLSGANQDGVIR